jgi:hypothetical protein
VRLLAGALSARSQVEVVSLGTAETSLEGREALQTRKDSVFVVHELGASRGDRLHMGLVRAALACGGAHELPEIAGARLAELGGGLAQGAVELVAKLKPDAVLLAGPETWWLPEAVRPLRPGTRVVSVPLIGDDALGGLGYLGPLLTGVDAVGVLSRAEGRQVLGRIDASLQSGAARVEVSDIEVAFSINRPAADQLMVGMSQFGRFVVLLTGFPDGSPAAERSPGHDYVRRWLGPVAVAEVALDRWLVSDQAKAREVPVGPSRANLWKLLGHAEVCLDLRPQGIVGRETIESLLLGTPVVVPEGTIAAELAESSNGGLWYRDFRELFGAAKAILDDTELRGHLSEQGRQWATEVHGNQGRFCEQVARFTFG